MWEHCAKLAFTCLKNELSTFLHLRLLAKRMSKSAKLVLYFLLFAKNSQKGIIVVNTDGKQLNKYERWIRVFPRMREYMYSPKIVEYGEHTLIPIHIYYIHYLFSAILGE